MQIYNLYKTLTYLHTVMTDNVVIKILNIEILHWLKKYDLILDKKNLIPILILKKEKKIKRIHYPINSSLKISKKNTIFFEEASNFNRLKN